MNSQHRLAKMRPPRVQITYDIEVGDALQKRELPFVIGIIAHSAGDHALGPLHERRFITIDGDNFDAVMFRLCPTLNIQFRGETLELKFEEFASLHPDHIIKKIPPLQAQLDQRIALTDLVGKLDGNIALDNALMEMIAESEDLTKVKACIPGNSERNDILMATFKEKVGDKKDIPNIYQYIIEQISILDHSISEGMTEVLHTPAFQALESRWRGLHYLISNTPSSQQLKLRVLSASRSELENDLYKSASFDLSNLFKKVYEEEYRTSRGIPYSCLVLDMYFCRNNADIDLLTKLSEIASAAHVPLLTGTASHMFGVDSFREMTNINDLIKLFESSEAVRFNGLRELEESRYLTMVMARSFGRAPYHVLDNPIESFRFTETAVSDADFCWINSAYCVAELITNAYSSYGWITTIRGFESGGLIGNLPVYNFHTDQGDIIMQCPTEIAITDRKERELSDLGFMPLCHIKHTNQSVLFGAQTVQKPQLSSTSEATANAKLSACLPYIMNASRFVHYLKVMIREKIGSSMSADDVERFLQNWLADYILLSTNPSAEAKARIPLREGKVIVEDNESDPGMYKVTVYLVQYSQIEGTCVSVRTVMKVPKLRAA